MIQTKKGCEIEKEGEREKGKKRVGRKGIEEE